MTTKPSALLKAVTEPEPYPVLAVELSSFQLHWSCSLRPFAAVVLNVAAHHLDWHGDIDSYAQAKGFYGLLALIPLCALAGHGLPAAFRNRRRIPGKDFARIRRGLSLHRRSRVGGGSRGNSS